VPDAFSMKKSKSLMSKTKEVAGEVGDAAMVAVKAVVKAAKAKLSHDKPKPRKRSAVATRPKASKSKAATKRRPGASKQSSRPKA
jgi:hypothetical protein